MNKSLSCVKSEFGIACCFNILIRIWDIRYFFFILCPAIIWTWETSLEDYWNWKMHILWCRTDICSCRLSAKVSLILDNSFPVPSLCKLNHISVCFIQISTKINWKQLILFRESHFFEVIPGVLGRSVNFNITSRFLLRRPVFPEYLSVSCDYDFCNQSECLK